MRKMKKSTERYIQTLNKRIKEYQFWYKISLDHVDLKGMKYFESGVIRNQQILEDLLKKIK